MSVDNSSVGSNDSHTRMLGHQGLKRVNNNYSVAGSVNRGRVTHALSDDALAQALMDPTFPTEGLENFDEWTIDLRKLNMGDAFSQGAFGKLYRGTYEGEEVAIKILERPKNDQERAQLMEQQFQQEVMMLATLKHPNSDERISLKKPEGIFSNKVGTIGLLSRQSIPIYAPTLILYLKESTYSNGR